MPGKAEPGLNGPIGAVQRRRDTTAGMIIAVTAWRESGTMSRSATNTEQAAPIRALIGLFAVILAWSWVGTGAPAQAADGYTPIQVAQIAGNEICCKKGNRDWITSRRECRNAGGRQIEDHRCKDDLKARGVCCKVGRSDFVTGRSDCRRRGGYVVADRQCRMGLDEREICCKKGRFKFRTTSYECRRAGGDQVRINKCSPHVNQGGKGGDRICCKRGGRETFTTRRSCRNIGGRIVANAQCRVGQYSHNTVCCRWQGRERFASRQECNRRSGRIVADRQCRK